MRRKGTLNLGHKEKGILALNVNFIRNFSTQCQLYYSEFVNSILENNSKREFWLV